MKTLFKILLTTIVIVSPVLGYSQADMPTHKAEGFSHPESVVLDEVNDVLYVSNMADKEEGDGFISKVTPSGEIIELKWITGLNDPKGLLVDGDKLYVTDNTEVVEMSINDAKITERRKVENAVSLNDITMDEAGSIFISDIGQNTIYFIPGEMAGKMMMNTARQGEISEFLKSDKLNSPNGLLAVRDNLYVGSWGQNQDGNLLKLDFETRRIENVTEEGIGNLDGIQAAGEDAVYVSDWSTGSIYKIDERGNTEKILTSEKSAGDILFLENEGKLVLPMNFQNAVWWYGVD